MRKLFVLLSSVALSSSLAMAATTDYINVKTINQYDVKEGDVLSASLIDLSPKAIEIGLRDAEILADANYNEKDKTVTIKWHSIAKLVKGTKLSENFSEPLITVAKFSNESSTIQARQKLVATGDVEGVVDAYNRLLKKAEEELNVDNSKSLETSSENDFTNKSGSDSSGGGYLSGQDDMTDKNDISDVEVKTDEIVESVEKCSLRVDIENGIVNEQERTIKTSTNTGSVVEVSSCANSGQSYPIRQDFEAGCSLQLDKSTGQYNKGYKLYAMVEGSRYAISDCEWDEAKKINYHVQLDYEACSFDYAVANATEGFYNPAFVKYTVIDGKRYNISECETEPTIKKDLPTELEQCDYRTDFIDNKAFEQKNY
uniref:DUF5666 domain-containing protein n=1 Tax=Vibrio splendidus TaxID=29497 RepID=A0A0H3ZKU7_VIBSP|nr:hypothetical protein [Vibrio splendidus]